MKRKYSRKQRTLLSLFPLFISISLAAVIMLRFFGTASPLLGGVGSDRSMRSVADSTAVMQYAKSVKADLKELLSAMKEGSVEQMERSSAQLDGDIDALKEELSRSIWDLAEMTPKVGKEITTARQLVAIADDANQTLLHPLVELMKEYPLSSLKAGSGLNVGVMLRYLDYLQTNIEKIESVCAELGELDLSVLDSSGSLQGTLEKVEPLFATYHKYETLIPAVRSILGNGEDRLYVFVAQNSAEIRASGGFPGSVGVMRITDGVLTISDFKSVYSVFHQQTYASISALENTLFGKRMGLSWDASFCPNFERVGFIWANAYERRNGKEVDGVISATPQVIQELLVLGDPITLSDGTEINSENATRVLLHELYFKYVSASQQNVPAASREMDALFSEVAKNTLSQLISNFKVGNLNEYVDVFERLLNERLIMFWMRDEAEEAVLRERGWTGSMNSDPNDPRLGIYFSLETSGKMGWYLDMEPTIGEPVVNADGSRSYPVSVVLTNVITEEDQRTGGTWILGRNYTGSVAGDLTLTAPAGGTITDISVNWSRRFTQTTYEDLDTWYLHWLVVVRGEPITVSFTVTTAPGIDTPLGILATPTLTKYR